MASPVYSVAASMHVRTTGALRTSSCLLLGREKKTPSVSEARRGAGILHVLRSQRCASAAAAAVARKLGCRRWVRWYLSNWQHLKQILSFFTDSLFAKQISDLTPSAHPSWAWAVAVAAAFPSSTVVGLGLFAAGQSPVYTIHHP